MSRPATYLLAYTSLLVAGLFTLRVVVRREYRKRGRLTRAPSMLQALLFFVYGGFPVLYLHADWPAVHVNPVQHALGLFLLYGGEEHLRRLHGHGYDDYCRQAPRYLGKRRIPG